MKKILIIEDDESIREIQTDYLKMSGYEVFCAKDGYEGLEMINSQSFDLVVLDLMLPKKDGFEILKSIGDIKDMPVIVLSAKDGEMHKIKALNLGADDYMTKPFSMGEFVARVRGHIKIYEKFNGKKSTNKQIKTGNLLIDETDRRVFLGEKEVILTQKEFELLLFLAKNPNRVFSKEALFERIWGYDAISDMATVTVHMSKLREKIESSPNKPEHLETVWGIGYRFKM